MTFTHDRRAGHSIAGHRRRVAVVRAALPGAVALFVVVGCRSTTGNGAANTTTTTPVPVDIHVDGTTKLRDGQGVRVHVTAKTGSQVFGFEARLCTGTEAFEFDSDMRPTKSGRCIPKPLSAASDSYQEVRAVAPFLVADSTFRVGVGTNQFVTESGTPVTITCGSGHPCQLVLKVQFPKGFAIRAFPLSYA